MNAPTRGTLYLLPELRFVGGNRLEFRFHCRRKLKQGIRPIELKGAQVRLSFLDYVNKTGERIFTRMGEIQMGTEDVMNVIYFRLEPEDTMDLWGKYIYQIDILDREDFQEIPPQGLMYIDKNINKARIER